MLDGVYLDYSKVIALEKMPTKLELIRDVAIMIKKVYLPCTVYIYHINYLIYLDGLP